MATNIANFDSQNRDKKLRKIFEGLGMCLSNYQHIERCLKFATPHLVAPNEVKEAIPYEDWPSLFNSKKTLGQLAAALSGSCNGPAGETFAGQLRELVEQRNELVHHFYDQPFSKFEKTEDYESAISYIRQRVVRSSDFLKMARHTVSLFMLTIERSFEMEDPVVKTKWRSGIK